MKWSTALADFVANNGRPEFREPATRVVRELDRFNNREAENGIAPLDLGGAIGIGINHQRKTWFLLGAALFWGLLALTLWSAGPVQMREPVSGDLSGWVLILPMFGGFGLLFVLLYLKQPGPDVVVIANPTSLYVVSRTALRFAPKEALLPWSENTARIELKTITRNMITTRTVSLSGVRRDSGRKRSLFTARVDEQLFRYWQQFGNTIERFM